MTRVKKGILSTILVALICLFTFGFVGCDTTSTNPLTLTGVTLTNECTIEKALENAKITYKYKDENGGDKTEEITGYQKMKDAGAFITWSEGEKASGTVTISITYKGYTVSWTGTAGGAGDGNLGPKNHAFKDVDGDTLCDDCNKGQRDAVHLITQ